MWGQELWVKFLSIRVRGLNIERRGIPIDIKAKLNIEVCKFQS